MPWDSVEHDGSGFQVISFEDTHCSACSLKQSSSIGDYDNSWDKPGSSAVWLGCDNNHPPHLGHKIPPWMHLNREQVAALIGYLQRWLETGSFV